MAGELRSAADTLQKAGATVVLVFDKAGKILFLEEEGEREVAHTDAVAKDAKLLAAVACGSREEALKSGIVFKGMRHEVHRFEPPCIWGRSKTKNVEDSVGAALLAAKDRELFILVTFKMPILTTEIVPVLLKIGEEITVTN